MPYDDIIEKHANRVGVDPMWLKKIMRIESGGDASNQTGSYKGLFQLSNSEFKKHGGTGSIFDPEQNTMAAANKLAQEGRDFKDRYGRDPTLNDLYMVHQQGAAGYAAHMRNPEGTAWENIRQYYKSDAIAKAAVWGNIPNNLKSQFGSVENVRSQDIVGIYGGKLEGTPEMQAYGPFKVAKAKPMPEYGGIRRTVGEEPDEDQKTIIGTPEEEFQPRQVGFRVPQLVPDFDLKRVS